MKFFRRKEKQAERAPNRKDMVNIKTDDLNTVSLVEQETNNLESHNDTADDPVAVTEDGQQFSSLEEAGDWIKQNREGITPVRWIHRYPAQNYPKASLTEEMGRRLRADPDLYATQLKQPRMSDRSIRVITLEPGTGLDRIHCRLEEKNLDPAAAYEALSYVWGDDTPRYVIDCNGAEFAIAANLHSALWQLREKGLLGPLWVDAISINQGDLEEKTVQVKMMRSVYAQATRVHIWLQRATADTEQAIAVLRHAHQVIAATQADPDPDEAYISITSLGLGDAPLEDVFKLWGFFAQTWFERSWVVQELAAAKCATFHIGAFELEADVVLTVAAALSRILPPSLAVEASVPWAKIESLKPFKFPASVFADVKRHYQEGRKWPLSRLVRCTAQLEAKEPHDKIFAFVGLAADGDASLVDYSTSVLDLHLSIAKKALLHHTDPHSEGVDFLSHVRTYLDSHEPIVTEPDKIRQLGLDVPLSDLELPSWAPHLNHWDHFFGTSIEPLSSWYSAKSISMKASPNIQLFEDKMLNIRGRVIDCVCASFESLPYRFQTRFTAHKETVDLVLEKMADWPLDCRNFVRGHGVFDRPGVPTNEATFARAVALNSAFGERESGARFLDWRYYKTHEAWCVVLTLVAKGHRSNTANANLYAVAASVVNTRFNEFIAAAETQDKPSTPQPNLDITAADVVAYARTFDRVARGRKFGVTLGGSMGWFPECSRPEDSIVLFDGCRLPVVLRYSEAQDTYRIVGDCCLNWCMDDEVFLQAETDIQRLLPTSYGLKIC